MPRSTTLRKRNAAPQVGDKVTPCTPHRRSVGLMGWHGEHSFILQIKVEFGVDIEALLVHPRPVLGPLDFLGNDVVFG